MGARRSRDEKASPALVDTEGFVLKAQVHSAKVMDFEKGSRRYCARRMSTFLACLICA